MTRGILFTKDKAHISGDVCLKFQIYLVEMWAEFIFILLIFIPDKPVCCHRYCTVHCQDSVWPDSWPLAGSYPDNCRSPSDLRLALRL